jgi:type I restriction enzyme S subunit
MTQFAPLSDLVSITGGGTPNRSKPDYYNGTIPWVTPKDMKMWDIDRSQETITEIGLQESASRMVPTGSVLIVIRSGILKHTLPVAIARRPLAINQDMKALVPHSGFDSEYIGRFIQRSAPIVLQWVRATTADNFPLDELKSLRVPLLSLLEQKRVALRLDQADRLRRMRGYALQMCNELLPATFLGIFGDLAANNMGWETCSLGELIITGPQNGLYKPASQYGSGTPILRIDAFHNGRLSDVRLLKRVRLTKFEAVDYRLNQNDLVINRVNSRSHLGKSVLIPRLPIPTVFESNMMRFSIDSERISPTFLVHQLQSPYLNRQIQMAAKDAVNQASINQDDVGSFEIRVPHIEVQRRFASYVHKYDRLRATKLEAIRQADHLFETLLHEAFVN